MDMVITGMAIMATEVWPITRMDITAITQTRTRGMSTIIIIHMCTTGMDMGTDMAMDMAMVDTIRMAITDIEDWNVIELYN